MVTANIGSLKKNTFWSTCGDGIICVQETRIGKNNVRSCSKDVEACGKKLYQGGLLSNLGQGEPPFWQTTSWCAPYTSRSMRQKESCPSGFRLHPRFNCLCSRSMGRLPHPNFLKFMGRMTSFWVRSSNVLPSMVPSLSLFAVTFN